MTQTFGTELSRDEVVPADIPIHLVGEALNVARSNGTVEHALLSLHVRAKAADIPPSIEVDISELELGGSIRVSDLDIPSSVTVDIDPETSVVIGQANTMVPLLIGSPLASVRPCRSTAIVIA